MKKKPHPIVKVFQFIALLLFIFIILAIFDCLARWSMDENNPQEPISYEENVELNNIEQHHRSEGHPILFVEDIF